MITSERFRRTRRAVGHGVMLMALAIAGCICLGVAPAGAHMRPLKADAAVFDHAVHIKISNLPASKQVVLEVYGASLQLFPTSGSPNPLVYESNGASNVRLLRNAAIVYDPASTPLTASLDITAKMQDGDALALTGNATIPEGVGVTIALDRHEPVHVENGEFNVPFS